MVTGITEVCEREREREMAISFSMILMDSLMDGTRSQFDLTVLIKHLDWNQLY